MKKILSIALIVGMGMISACGGGNKDAENAKARQDSIDAAAREQAIQDSISAAAPKDILATATAAGNFSTLAKAIEAAGLTGTLSGPGPFTVFAPTDAAFNALPSGTLDNLLKPESLEDLRDLLTYHVVSGSMSSADVVAQKELTMMNGSMAKIGSKNGMATIGDASITQADIVASNGTIHAIDKVIMPSKKSGGKKGGAAAKGGTTEKPKEENKSNTIDITKPKQGNSENKIDLNKPKQGTPENKIDITKPKKKTN